MNKKFLFILALLIFINPAFSASENKFERAGTPEGFYDDIDPDTLEEEEKIEQKSSQDEESPYIHYDNGGESYHQISEPAKPIKNYSEIYNSLEMAAFSYIHNIDPEEFYDVKDAAWSIYPLLRLNSAIYFKDRVIEPGYYLLTPREHKGKWYILFKQNGKVVHIIPVYDRDYTPESFYDQHIPKPKLTKTQKDSDLPEFRESKVEMLYYISAGIAVATISCRNHDNSYKIDSLGIKTLESFEKYTVDVLGEYHPVRRETRKAFSARRN